MAKSSLVAESSPYNLISSKAAGSLVKHRNDIGLAIDMATALF